MQFFNRLLISVIILYTGCFPGHKNYSAAISKDGEEILYGPVTAEQLFLHYAEWKETHDIYQPQTEVLSELKPDPELAVEIFFGTWCGDSQREVPRFLKIIHLSQLVNNTRMQLYAVDRDKKLESGLTTIRNIEKVATFIFYRSGYEIGRIIEYPDRTLEEDIKRIVELK